MRDKHQRADGEPWPNHGGGTRHQGIRDGLGCTRRQEGLPRASRRATEKFQRSPSQVTPSLPPKPVVCVLEVGPGGEKKDRPRGRSAFLPICVA